ncbi:hypothetical protein QM565_22510 [Geitlerinema splendidum]|nr:hypothetical protein [Geitlerinema splendidum]
MKKLFIAFALLILLCAAFLRFWQLSEYPPGPHYDEGAYLLITRSIAFGGARFFPIVEAYQGREVLYMYLAAPLLHLLGDDIFTLRLTSAFANLITVAGTIALGRLMFSGRRGWVIGLTAGVLIAISFPQFWLARQAFRAVTLPLMQALALACLWRGLRAGRGTYLWLAVAGLLAGSTIYTYMASRLFPLWLLIGGLVLLTAGRSQWRVWLPRGLMFFCVMGVTLLPMVIYAVRQPDIFFGRLEEVTQPDQSVSLLESIRLHLEMFFIRGDSYFRYNIPNRPYLTPPEGVFMMVGMAVAVRRLLRRGVPLIERPAYALAVLSPLMVIPSVISVGGLPPSHMRSLGMIPLLFILVAIGFEAVTSRLPALLTRQRLAGLLMICLLGGTLHGWTIYREWASNALVYYENDADLAAAADWLIEQKATGILEDDLIYVAARDRGHPTVMIRPVPPIIWLGTDSLFWPPFDQSATYIFPRSAPPPPDWGRLLEENASALSPLPLGPDQRPAFEAFRVLRGTALPPPAQPGDDNIRNPYLSWAGTDAANITSVEGVVTVRWRIDNPPLAADFTPILQVEDDQGIIFSRSEAYVTETDRWVPGSVLFQRMPVILHPATPSGEYRLRMAWVARAQDAYASYLNADGTLAGIWADVGTITVSAPLENPEGELPEISRQLPEPQAAAEGVRLLGSDRAAETVRPGEHFDLALYWQAAVPVPPWTYRILLVSPEHDDIQLYAGPPLRGRSATELWQPDQVVRDMLRLTVPRDAAPGSYALMLALPNGRADLGSLIISGIPRQMEPPPFAEAVDQRFGDWLRFAGYSLEQTADEIDFAPVWQALDDGTADLKYFVHMVDAQGNILAQADAFPRENTYSTQLWGAGEYVDDRIRLPRVSEAVMLRVGWYDPVNGARLLLEDSRDAFEIPLLP